MVGLVEDDHTRTLRYPGLPLFLTCQPAALVSGMSTLVQPPAQDAIVAEPVSLAVYEPLPPVLWFIVPTEALSVAEPDVLHCTHRCSTPHVDPVPLTLRFALAGCHHHWARFESVLETVPPAVNIRPVDEPLTSVE